MRWFEYVTKKQWQESSSIIAISAAKKLLHERGKNRPSLIAHSFIAYECTNCKQISIYTVARTSRRKRLSRGEEEAMQGQVGAGETSHTRETR